MTEGYIKFNCEWEQKEISIPASTFLELEASRDLLFKQKLIGMYPDGIGYGNISTRIDKSTFLITGSATGQFEHLTHEHYAVVTDYNFQKNSISCTGKTKASSESLTHAAVYEILPEVSAVVHIHCLWLWEKLLNILPTTPSEIEYGTPEMALSIQKIISETEGNTIIMGGHREGILSFGQNLDEATSSIIRIYNHYQHD